MIEFVKMSGSGNDFVVIDNRDEISVAESKKTDFVRGVCARKTGVGADGVLMLENSECGDFRMRYFNSDGGEAEFCGNGGRCIAHFAHHSLGFPRKMTFNSLAGIVSAGVNGDTVELQMPRAGKLEGPKKLALHDENLEYYFIDTGVPHAVIFVENLKIAPVVELGREIRSHERFYPKGTNVDFVLAKNQTDHDIALRTYERGVEDETSACGTGAVAAAIVAQRLGLANFPVKVKFALPDIVTIDMDESGKIIFSGDVRRVFEGKYISRLDA